MVLPSVHAESATLRNPKWRQEREKLTIVADLPRIYATTPLPCKNFDGQGVHSAPVKFSNLTAKKFVPDMGVKFLNGKASSFRTFSVFPCERNP